MRNWLSWTVGFVLSFGAFFLFMFAYSLTQASLWLPVLFGFVFYGLLSFAPNVSFLSRTGLTLLFGAGSCYFWVASGSITFQGRHGAVRLLFLVLLAAFAILGLLLTRAGTSKKSPKSAPAFLPILLLILFGWLISYFSSSAGGASPMVEWVMRTFGLSAQAAETVVVAFRKSVHVGFYAVTALTALASSLKNGATRRLAYAAALLTTFSYACFDEVRQSTQANRGGSGWDVLLDMVGGCIAVGGVALLTSNKTAVSPKTTRKSTTL